MLGRLLFVCLICFSLIGCTPALNPGNWDQARVEKHLKEKHNLVEVTLSPEAQGGFTGSGKTSEGEIYNFKVTQDATAKRLSWEFKSDRGDVGSEVLEIVNVK